jgi:hypothetical protein
MKTFIVTKNFKESVTEILMEKKFNAVYPYMNLINREGFEYAEGELNSLVQFLSEFPYANVAEFFASIKENVKEVSSEIQESEPIPTED